MAGSPLKVACSPFRTGPPRPGGVAPRRGDRTVSHIVTTPVDANGDEKAILGALCAAVEEPIRHAGEHEPVTGIGIGFPGPFNYRRGICLVRGLAKFERIYGMDISAALWERLEQTGVVPEAETLPIAFRNDAEAAIIGEVDGRPELARGRIIGITLGTGIGSHLVAGGEVVRDTTEFRPDGWLYDKPFRGRPADDQFSTRGLTARFQAAGVTVDGAGLAGVFRRWESGGDPRENSVRGESGGGAADYAPDEYAPDELAAITQVYRAFGTDLGTFLQEYVTAVEATGILVLGGVAGAFPAFGPALSGAVTVPVYTGRRGAAAAIRGAALRVYTTLLHSGQ